MKECPACRRVYSDDALKFCRIDGAALSSAVPDSRETLLKLPRRPDDTRVTGSLSESKPLRLSQITFSETIEEYPAWSRDGDIVAFSREEVGIRSIYVKTIATGEERRLTAGEYDDIQPGWSLDAAQVLFVRSRKPGVKLEPGDVFGQFSDGDIWAIDVDTLRETRLIEKAFNPDYSPDGK